MFRRDDARRDASDTYGACNVLTRRRPRTFQSVVVVVRVLLYMSVSNAHRHEKEKKKLRRSSKSSSSSFPPRRRPNLNHDERRVVLYSFKNLLQVFLGEEDDDTITMRREKNNAQNKNNNKNNNKNENVPSRVSPVQTTRF